MSIKHDLSQKQFKQIINRLKNENQFLKTDLIRVNLLLNNFEKYFNYFNEINETIASNNEVLDLKNNIKVLKECQKSCFVSLEPLSDNRLNLLSQPMSDVSTQTQTNDLETTSRQYIQVLTETETTNQLIEEKVGPKSSPDKELVCNRSGCEYRTRDRYTLTSHASIHMVNPFKCLVCCLSFTREDRLKEHQRQHEKPFENRQQNNTKFKCDVKDCPLIFFKKSELIRHTNTDHSDVRPYLYYLCKCGVSYKSRKLFNDHKLLHLGRRQFKCYFKGCAKTFLTGNQFFSHKLEHTKPFVCSRPECGHRFAFNRELMAHMIGHQKEPPFDCPIIGCFYSFKSTDLLNGHLRAVHF